MQPRETLTEMCKMRSFLFGVHVDSNWSWQVNHKWKASGLTCNLGRVMSSHDAGIWTKISSPWWWFLLHVCRSWERRSQSEVLLRRHLGGHGLLLWNALGARNDRWSYICHEFAMAFGVVVPRKIPWILVDYHWCFGCLMLSLERIYRNPWVPALPVLFFFWMYIMDSARTSCCLR